MNSRKLLTRVVPSTLAAVGVAVLTVTMVKAFNPQPDPPGHYFGLVGIVEGQTLQVNVSNVAFGGDPRFPPGPCRGTLALFDVMGNVVSSKVVAVPAGGSDRLSISADEVFRKAGEKKTDKAGDASGRAYLRAAMVFRKAGGNQQCVSDVEVFGMEGSTSLFLHPGSIVGFNPQPDPPGVN